MEAPGTNTDSCQSKERADVAKLEAVSERLNGSINGRKDHNQVADSVPEFRDVKRGDIILFAPVQR